MSADEIKKTPDVEAAAEPEKTEVDVSAKQTKAEPVKADVAPAEAEAGSASAKAEAEAAKAGSEATKVDVEVGQKKQVAKPAARKSAAGKADEATDKADDKPASKPSRKAAAKAEVGEEVAPASKKSAATEASAADAATEAGLAAKKPAAKSSGKKPAAKKAAEATTGAAEPAAEAAVVAAAQEPERAPRKAAPKAERVAQRPPKQKAAAKVVPEARKGVAGVATVVDASGKELETRNLVDSRFAVPADVNTLHLVVRAEQAARRSGTASTKTRGMVSGSTAKLYRQKGTGRARAGSVKSPIRTGGGVVFGPHPRSFDIKINKKVIRKALSMALSERAAHGRVFVAAGLELAEPSTRIVEQFLVNLDCAAPVLIVTNDEPVVLKSVRNLPYAEASEVAALSTEQVLRARSLVLTEKAFAALNEA